MHIPEGAKHAASSTAKNFLFETLTSAAGSFLSSFFEPMKEKAGDAGRALGKEVVKAFSELRDEMFAWVHGEFAEQTKGTPAHENFNRRWKMRQLRQHKPYAGDDCQNFDPATGKCRKVNCLWHYKPGDEIQFVAIWTGAYQHLGDKDEEEKRFTLFQYYFMLHEDKEFDTQMQQLVHDVMKQFTSRTLQLFKDFTSWMDDKASGPLGLFADFLENLPGGRG